ncbi:winged helix-turn-helix transcriptional regulator [Rhodococcus sp. NPDC019627]|uniref:winged helix-turn-helix transcriptional regulator n=1 Tax=unclassified Rhodococcus (in: high G+C Gram-positive bacteria) TaxID=192944 RepID=UPI0033D45643
MDAEEAIDRISAVDRMMTNVRGIFERAATVSNGYEELFEYLAGQLVEFAWDRHAPVVGVTSHIGNYWRNWLLVILRTGPIRPSTIRRLLDAMDPSHPLSQRILTQNLRMLERDGLLERAVVVDTRKHVEYSLTPLGRDLSDHIMRVIDWGYAHSDHINDARRRFDANDA